MANFVTLSFAEGQQNSVIKNVRDSKDKTGYRILLPVGRFIDQPFFSPFFKNVVKHPLHSVEINPYVN